DGSGWSLTPFGKQQVLRLWGSGPRDVWAVGTDGLVQHFDGSGWREAASLVGIDSWSPVLIGAGGNDVWVAAGGRVNRMPGGGLLADWTGSALETVATFDSGLGVTAGFALAPDDVWFVGPELLHWNGRIIDRRERVQGDVPSAVWGTRSDDV